MKNKLEGVPEPGMRAREQRAKDQYKALNQEANWKEAGIMFFMP